MADKKTEYDPFIANHVFPDAEAVFSRETKSLDAIKADALIVLDTNALLVPYTVGKESLDKIRQTYELIKKQERLCVPGQVAREFANNRPRKLAELSHQLSQKMDKVSLPKKDNYPLLESFPEYTQLIEAEEAVDRQLKVYRKKVKAVLDLVKNWTWNDPVSSMYSELFTCDVVFDLPIDCNNDVLTDLLRRQIHSLPPGYKDSSKDDKGIGDLLIWLTILTIAATKNKHVIFVSGDEKSDWWQRSNGKPLYPRYELVSEFQSTTNGNSFHIISFADFLELFGASQTIVSEVGTVESTLSEDQVDVELVRDAARSFFIAYDELTLYCCKQLDIMFPGLNVSKHKPNVVKEAVGELYKRRIVTEDFLVESQVLTRFKTNCCLN